MIPDYHVCILMDNIFLSFVLHFFLILLEGCVLYKRWAWYIMVYDLDTGC